MTILNEKLAKITSSTPSKWYERAKWRQQNRKWLRYSSNVARRVLAAIDDIDGMTQKKLAEKIGVSPQYISRVVKGEENLSLETIAKLSEALGIELISFPEIYSKSAKESAVKASIYKEDDPSEKMSKVAEPSAKYHKKPKK